MSTELKQSFVDFEKMKKVHSSEEFRSIIDGIGIEGGIGRKTLENLDLSDVDFSKGIWNLDGWYIHNVAFSRFREDTNEKKIIFGLSCKGAYLHEVSFVHSKMVRCNFDTEDPDANHVNISNKGKLETNTELINPQESPKKIMENDSKVSDFDEFYNVSQRQEQKPVSIIKEVDFSMSELEFCRFRNTYVMVADFRYSHIKDCSLSESKFFASDFYFCSFKDATNFIDSRFIRCSFTNAVFENNCIRLQNIPHGILQENYEAYHYIISKFSTWRRLNPCSSFSSLNHGECRGEMNNSKIFLKKESAEFYKQISGIYAGKGLNRDSNRAYKKSKQNEFYFYALSFTKSVKELSFSRAGKILWKLFINRIIALFGYGYQWLAAVIWFAILITIYGWSYYDKMSKDGIEIAMSYSFNNSLSPFRELANIVGLFAASCQTAIGMLLIGFLGFIIANNIRNDS